MATIEIPVPDFRVKYEVDGFYPDDYSVTFSLVFGDVKVFEQTYDIPRLDYERVHFDARRRDFDDLVADRLKRVFV